MERIESDVTTSIEFVSACLRSADLGGSRGRLDMFADRLLKASSEPTLMKAMEHLFRSARVSADEISPQLVSRVATIANTDIGARILRWWRESAKLVTMIAATKDEAARNEALAEIALPSSAAGGRAVSRGPFRIALTARCETALAHGADGKAGNATLFRRQRVLTTEGSTLDLPYYSGNAVRGQMRDLLADHLLTALGMSPSRNSPPIALWFFYALYSGGALEEKSEATKAIQGRMGDNGATRAQGIREFREMLPALSLLGTALGNRVLPGRMQVADLRPDCYEWNTGSQIPVAELLTWEYLTRREDLESHDEHHGMIANTEVLRAGASLVGGIDTDGAIRDVEDSALALGLELLRKRGMLGAENRRGLGKVQLEIAGCANPAPYLEHLATNKEAILSYLRDVGAMT